MKEAKLGSVASQLALGECYISGGEGLGKSLVAAYRWLSAAADRGSQKAIWLIGENIPSSVVDSPNRAKSYYLVAASLGSIRASTIVARWYLNGVLGPIDSRKMAQQKEYLRKAAHAGDLVAQLTIGSLVESESAEESVYWLEKAAERGDKGAAVKLLGHYWDQAGGSLWLPGQVPSESVDFRNGSQIEAAEQALQWHEKIWGNSPGTIPVEEQRRRGELLLLARNRGGAKFLEYAATENDPISCYLLGLLYIGPSYVCALGRGHKEVSSPSGRWFPRNYKLGAYWLEKAAGKNIAEACFGLYLLHGKKYFNRRDLVARKQYLDKAANLGHPEACWLLGKLEFSKGKLVESAKWFEVASMKGHCGAETTLAAVAANVGDPKPELLRAAHIFEAYDAKCATRLALGASFHLTEHELLLINPAESDCGDYLLVDISHCYSKAKPRLIRINANSQREELKKAKLTIGAEPRPSGGDYRKIVRRFRNKCKAVCIDVKTLF